MLMGSSIRICALIAFAIAALMGSRPLLTSEKQGAPSGTDPMPPSAAATKTVSAIDPSLAMEVHTAVDRSLDWLAANQNENGSWSNTNYPALTGLPLWAFANSEHPRIK